MDSKYTWNIHLKIYFGSILPNGDSTLLTLDFEKLQEATLQVHTTSLLKMGYENVTFPSCFAILQDFCKKTILLFWNFLKILGVIILDRIKSVLFSRNFYLCLLKFSYKIYFYIQKALLQINLCPFVEVKNQNEPIANFDSKYIHTQ